MLRRHDARPKAVWRDRPAAHEDEARKALKAKLREAAAGRHVSPQEERVTVSELLEDYERHLTMKGAKAMVSFRAHAKAVREAFGPMRALDVATDRVERFKAAQLGAGKAPATVNRYVEALRAAFNLARRTERVSRVPYFPLLELHNVRQGFFEKAEFEEMVKHLPDPIADVARFGYLTGWRKGEIVPLTWEQVDRRAGEVRIYDSKNGEGRVLPLVGELADLIERRWAARMYESPQGSALSRFVFHDRGRTVRDFRKSWASACKEAGVSGRLFHDLRRSAVRDILSVVGSGSSEATSVKSLKTIGRGERI